MRRQIRSRHEELLIRTRMQDACLCVGIVDLSGDDGDFRASRGNVEIYRGKCCLCAIDGTEFPHDVPDVHLDGRLSQFELPPDQLV